MDDQQILNFILQNTFTKACFLKRLALLRGYLEAKYYKKADLDIESYLNTGQVNGHDRLAVITWKNQFIHNFTAQNSYQIINKLTENLNRLPIITLYLAVIISDNDIDKIGGWFRNILKTQVLLDINLNPNLVAGCAFVYNGKYYDYSLRNLISSRKDQISRILQNYASNN